MDHILGAVPGFIVGIVTGFISSYLFDRYLTGKEKTALKQLRGLWFEEFEDASRRGYALGAFHWDRSQRAWRYDGTRFTVNGKALYHWRSRSLVPDQKLRIILYTYENTPIGEAKPNENGLGHIDYGPGSDSGPLEFTTGVFSDHTHADHVYLKMRRFSKVFDFLPFTKALDPDSRVKLGQMIATELSRRADHRKDKNANDEPFLAAAVAEAEAGLAEGGIPIGAVLVCDGKVIGRGHNQRVQKGNPVLHGEMDALENAGRLSAAIYTRATLYTTLSPCAMCSGAILLYRIPRVVIGENSTFMGEEEILRRRGVLVDVMQDKRCVELMSRFKREKPTLWNEDIGV